MNSTGRPALSAGSALSWLVDSLSRQSATVHDDDNADRPPTGGTTGEKPPLRVDGARAPEGISPSGRGAAFAAAEGRADVLDPRPAPALVLVAVGRRLPLGGRRRPDGLGDRRWRHGARELPDRAPRGAAAVRPGA